MSPSLGIPQYQRNMPFLLSGARGAAEGFEVKLAAGMVLGFRVSHVKAGVQASGAACK